MGWALALHGGAGDISRSMDLEKRQKVEEALQEYLQLGISALKSSHSALDVVELVVRQLENNPVFNAGRGSVLTCAGTVEMEACIMDGPSKASGAVSGLSTVVNPISLARLVMEKTPHVYLAFEGAEKFARKQGVEVMDPNYFITDANVKRLHAAQQANIVQLDHSASSMSEDGKVENGETVGCVAVDEHGNCAAATSTGGLVNKMVGRIGDTPLVGAGNYANNLCAISATGKGEAIIGAMVSYEIAALMEFKSMSLSEAVNNVIGTKLGKGNGGVVAVSSDGDVVTAFNTTGMYRASANSAGEYEMGIW